MAEATEFSWSRSLYHQGGYPYFKKYKFAHEIPAKEGISAFDVEVVDTAADGSISSTMHTNGGNGFPFEDNILTQPQSTCNGQRASGLFNLTVAVRAKTTSWSLATKTDDAASRSGKIPA